MIRRHLKTIILVLATVLVVLPAVIIACAPAVAPTAEPKAAKPAPGPSTKQAWEQKWDKALEGARNEGKLMLYASLGPATISELTKIAKGKWGVDLEVVSLPAPAEILAKVQTERRAGLYVPDVFLFGATSLLNLFKPQGILDPVEPLLMLPEVTDPKAWQGNEFPFIDNDRLVVGFISYATRYVTRNTELTKEGDIKSYRDLLKPQWKGKIVMYDPTTTGSGNSFVSHVVALSGEDGARDFLRELVKQEPVITRDKHVQVEWVARGKHLIAIATDGEKSGEFIKLGAPIEHVILAEGTTITTGAGCLAVPSQRPHPNAAAVFVNWILTSEGQTVFVKNFGKPSGRLDVSTAGIPRTDLLQPGEKFIKENETSILYKGKLVEFAKPIFAPLFK